MTPQEKAKELVSKYIHLTKQTTGANGTIYNSKQCALIAVDEVRDNLPLISDIQDYWIEVKQEIKKL
jgi:hypothetical protein